MYSYEGEGRIFKSLKKHWVKVDGLGEVTQNLCVSF